MTPANWGPCQSFPYSCLNIFLLFRLCFQFVLVLLSIFRTDTILLQWNTTIFILKFQFLFSFRINIVITISSFLADIWKSWCSKMWKCTSRNRWLWSPRNKSSVCLCLSKLYDKQVTILDNHHLLSTLYYFIWHVNNFSISQLSGTVHGWTLI
jgi:hypothetical protein